MKTLGILFVIEANLHAVGDLALVIQYYTVQFHLFTDTTAGQDDRIRDLALATHTGI
jgi:hypothetical protein